MSRKNTGRYYVVIQSFFIVVAVAFLFVVGMLLVNEFSSENDFIHHKINNIIKHVDSGFENDELLKVFHDLSNECDDHSTINVDSIPENELNELYQFLTQNYAHIKLDAKRQSESDLVVCAISAAENIGVPADMLTEFIGYTLTTASQSNQHFEPDAFLVYAAENFVNTHNEYGVEGYDFSMIYNSLDVIFEFMVYLLLVTFLFLLMRIERNTRK
ncbi:hypothetical protein [Raoultella sp. C349492]|uniref:hypothetical protein n=1 Tax=Raoultella sp. C349492 TaxID=2970253 RepID=UPI0035C68B57